MEQTQTYGFKNNNNRWSFACQKDDIIMRQDPSGGLRNNYDHTGLFDVHSNLSAPVFSAFLPHRNSLVAAGPDPATCALAGQHPIR